MNILHIDSEMTWRGGQNQIWLLIEGMLQKHREGTSQFMPYLACMAGSALAKKAADQGFPNLFLLEKPWFKPINVLKLKKFILEHKIRLVDVHASKAHNLALMTKLLKCDYKLLVHRRVDYIPKTEGFSGSKYKTPLVDGYIAISAAIARILEEANLSKEKIFVVRSAIDASFYESVDRESSAATLRQKFGISQQELVILAVGALSDQKRYDVLIEALALLKEKQKDGWRAVLLGDGPLRESLLALREQKRLTDHLIMPGFRNDVRESLAGADIFAHSAEFEGLGTILMDAASAALPIVSTSVGGIPEIVKHNVNGFLVNNLDSQSLADNLLILIQNETLRKNLGDAGQRFVKEECSLEQMVQGNLNVYKKFL